MAGLSKLRAVNICLENIGESPVNTLSGSSSDAFVSTAQSILDEAARDVCEERWNFNMDHEYAMVPDVNGNIVIADNMLAVDASDKTLNYSVRQGKLYNMDDQTFTFTDSVDTEVVWEFAYDELPQHVRKYVAIKAARVFARRMLGDDIAERLTQQDELKAMTSAKRHDLSARDRTIWQDYGSGLHRLKRRRI